MSERTVASALHDRFGHGDGLGLRARRPRENSDEVSLTHPRASRYCLANTGGHTVLATHLRARPCDSGPCENYRTGGCPVRARVTRTTRTVALGVAVLLGATALA